MLNNEIRFSSKHFHFEEAKLSINIVHLVYNSLDPRVLLKFMLV